MNLQDLELASQAYPGSQPLYSFDGLLANGWAATAGGALVSLNPTGNKIEFELNLRVGRSAHVVEQGAWPEDVRPAATTNRQLLIGNDLAVLRVSTDGRIWLLGYQPDMEGQYLTGAFTLPRRTS